MGPVLSLFEARRRSIVPIKGPREDQHDKDTQKNVRPHAITSQNNDVSFGPFKAFEIKQGQTLKSVRVRS